MKMILVIFLLSAPAFAQSAPPVPLAAGAVCSNLPNTIFDVKTDNREHTVQPVAGKALVYFLQDDTNYIARPRPTTRLAVDGAWVGATRSDSYFYFSVEPGEHHLCANWQGGGLQPVSGVAAAHFTAVAGHAYYFRVQNGSLKNGEKTIEFGREDSDEGQLLTNRYAFSSSSIKK